MKEKARKEEKNKGYITVKEACELFSTNRWSLRRDINKYRIKTYLAGRCTMVNRKELKALYKPILHIGQQKILTPLQAIITNRAKPLIEIVIKCSKRKHPIVKKFFKDNINGQTKWITRQKKIYDDNQKLYFKKTVNQLQEIDVDNYIDIVDWGDFEYFEKPA